jgi:hypothetical protein
MTEACKLLNQKKGIIITYDEEKNVKIDDISIDVMPIWKWIVEKNFLVLS